MTCCGVAAKSHSTLCLKVIKLEMILNHPAGSSRAVSAFAKVETTTRLDDIRDDWIALASEAAISPYQTHTFLSKWADTIGRRDGAAPFIICARNSLGQMQAIVPLCLERRAGLDIALFLGGRESNFNLPILAHGPVDESAIRMLLHEAARQAARKPDLYYFRSQPRCFDGAHNPFVFADSRMSASMAYGTSLPAREADLAARFSADTRKKLRKKAARLETLGPLVYDHDARGAAVDEILEALIEQKSARFAEMGIRTGFDTGGVRAFLEQLVTQADHPLELHALRAGGRIVATYAGIVRGGRFSAMLNSYDMSEEIARSSPGDLLLHALMRNLVSRGFAHFDLGAGEARYKKAVCEETIELYDTIVPVSLRGALATSLLAAFLGVKRQVKKSDRLTRAYHRLRAKM